VNGISDSDVINDQVTVNKTIPTNVIPIGLPIRFGRLLIDNGYGPDTENLPLNIHTQYRDGTGAKGTKGNAGLSPALDPNKTTAEGAFTLASGQHTMELTAPTNLLIDPMSYQGQIRYTYDQTPIWLQFNWDRGTNYDNNASGIATFSLFRGNDRIIYRREK
jgi:MSHA biogenesis protein MshQ